MTNLRAERFRAFWRRSIVVTDYSIPTDWPPTDWQATLDDYKPGDPIGRGPTEAGAVYALYEQLEERDALYDRQFQESSLTSP